MPHIYLTKSTYRVGIRAGQIVLHDTEGKDADRTYPFAKIDGISVFGTPQLSTQLIRECIAANVPILFYSDDGHYFGNISSSKRIDPLRQKKQILLTNNRAFCLDWAKNIIDAKVRNSLTLLYSMPDIYMFEPEETQGLRHSLAMLSSADSLNMLLGLEGNAAKNYFSCLPKLLKNDDFRFSGRSSRPPKDPFNSMLSYGYSLFYRNIIGAIERHGLHPYFAYMHQLKFGHAALASDLIEEYRAPLIDRTIIEIANSGELEVGDFYTNPAGAIYMNRKAMQRVTDAISGIIAKGIRYFQDSGDRRAYGFQVMLDMKLTGLIEAIEHEDASLYHPYIWEPDGR